MPKPPRRRTSSTTADASPAEAIRRCTESERYVVPGVGADLHRVDAQDAARIARRLGLSSAVAVIREHDELKTRPCGSGSNLGPRARAVGQRAVDVEGAGDGAPAEGLDRGSRLRERTGTATRPPTKRQRRPRWPPSSLSLLRIVDDRALADSQRHRRCDAGSAARVGAQRLGLVGPLPGELRLGPAEVPERRRLR